jgi:hypothetical protein
MKAGITFQTVSNQINLAAQPNLPVAHVIPRLGLLAMLYRYRLVH